MAEEDASLHSSRAEVWYLKDIEFGLIGSPKRKFKIVTQNFNGPCSFIAICNILILRGNIEILPVNRKTVSYELLSQLIGEYLLTNVADIDISAALSVMPKTQQGMDLNPRFTGAISFRPAGTGGELLLFEQAGITLVHGWLVDPSSAEANVVLAKAQDYDTAVTFIAGADHTAKGQLVVDELEPQQAGPSSPTNWTDEERVKIEDAIVIRRFLENTRSQLTYHGLFTLASTLEPGSLVALFRNSHLSVLYKSEGEESALYSLVTDQVFLYESSVVWERLEDVDGGWSTFVDSDFVPSNPVGGDFVGQTAEDALRAAETEAGQFADDHADYALAQQLQSEEQDRARWENEQYRLQQERRRQAQAEAEEAKLEKARKKAEKKSDCIIM